MEFGRVGKKTLEQIDFSLPAEPAFNSTVLPGKACTDPKVYIGCAKWGKTEWLGKLYPLKTPEKDFLKNYVMHYNSIELNATHYKIYGPETITKWSANVKGKTFKFCPKLYQGITHSESLRNKGDLLNEFFRGIIAFKENLGPVFIQLSESFSPGRKEELFAFLKTLPVDLQFFVEVRHPEWFSLPAVTNALYTTLRELNMGIVITDTAGRRDCAHMHLTISKTFIRYVGNSLHTSDYTRIDAWIKRMKYWLDKGMEEVYFFMHMHEEATSPELTVYLVDEFNKATGMKLEKPVFMEQQGSLF